MPNNYKSNLSPADRREVARMSALLMGQPLPPPAPTVDEIVKDVRRQLAAAPWRCLVCPQRRCRRRRRCNPRDLICVTKVLSREQQTQMLAKINAALEAKGEQPIRS